VASAAADSFRLTNVYLDDMAKATDGYDALIKWDSEGESAIDTGGAADDQQLEMSVEDATGVIGEGSSVNAAELSVNSSTQRGNHPLGSSQNPIRIIQQGNKYTSMQELSTEQLNQIMQVHCLSFT